MGKHWFKNVVKSSKFCPYNGPPKIPTIATVKDQTLFICEQSPPDDPSDLFSLSKIPRETGCLS